MKFWLIVIALLSFSFGYSQETGTVKGTVTDLDMNNEPLPFAGVAVKGTSIGTNTDDNGNYTLKVPVGKQTLIFTFVSYESIEVPVTVVAGKTVTINQALTATSVQLGDVVIESTISRERESALLLEQKNAVEIRQNIGAQEMARKGVSDVATAVTKTTGISRQEGSGSVYVRGLGDRYNISTMNGLPLPSNNPSRKNIQLDIFSADIVEYIGIDKTYNLTNYGDFGGANIDISSKNYKGNGFFEVGVGTGVNTNAIEQDNFYLQDGPAFTGFSNQKQPENPLGAYNFTTNWNKQTANPINGSISFKGGDSYDVGEESRLSFFATGSFDSEYLYRDGIARGNISAQGIPRKDFDYVSYSHSTNTTLMGNVNYSFNQDHKINFNTLFINSSNQSHEEYSGIIDLFDNAPEGGGLVRRSTFDRTSLYVNQLLGSNKFSETFDLDWGLSYNVVNNVIPDRMQNTLVPPNPAVPEEKVLSDLADSDNHRYFQDLNENEIAANVFGHYKFNMGDDELYLGKLTFGYSSRIKTTSFEATQFNFRLSDNLAQPLVDPNNLDAYFNQQNLDAGLFSIRTYRGGAGVPGVLRPQTYDGSQNIHAGFVSAEYKFAPEFTVIAGVRVEQIMQDIEWNTSLGTGDSKISQVEILPSVTAKYELNEQQNLKFAASKTYTLPQFKERAPFMYEEVTQVFFGNKDLYPSTNYNIDLKWECFPDTNEILSATVFGKYIKDPINEVVIASATNDISWVNSGEKAIVLGGEVEIRKDIFDYQHGENQNLSNALSAGANITYMYNNQDFDSEKVVRETDLSVFFTNDEGQLSGASDLLLNADLSYYYQFAEEKNIQTTLAYNYFSDRLYGIGTNNRGNQIDKAVGTLDFIVKSQLNNHFGIGFSLRNILNPQIERYQERNAEFDTVGSDVDVISYKKGLVGRISLTYTF